MITPLNFPKAQLKLSRKDEQVFVWCIIRKKNLVCTPEEWVRQHAIHFLIDNGIPQGRIASEYALEYNGRSKRADIVVFDASGKPEIIVECKAPEVPINEAVLRQIATYNNELKVEKLILTNGLSHIYCRVNLQTAKLQIFSEISQILM